VSGCLFVCQHDNSRTVIGSLEISPRNYQGFILWSTGRPIRERLLWGARVVRREDVSNVLVERLVSGLLLSLLGSRRDGVREESVQHDAEVTEACSSVRAEGSCTSLAISTDSYKVLSTVFVVGLYHDGHKSRRPKTMVMTATAMKT